MGVDIGEKEGKRGGRLEEEERGIPGEEDRHKKEKRPMAREERGAE
jgi:hypothetical protein